MTEVHAMVGHSIHPQEPLMTAGLDSLGGMELRRALAETLGLDLPQTLLYDYQSIAAITAHLNSLIEAEGPTAPVHTGSRLSTAPVRSAVEASTAGTLVHNVAEDSVQSVGQAAAYWDDRPAEADGAEGSGEQARQVTPLQQNAAQPSNLLKTLR